MDNLTVVIPFWNGHRHLSRTLAGIPDNIPVIIVDDHSDQPLVGDYGKNVTIVRPPKRGYFSGAVNYGIGQCNTDVLVLNQDTELRGTEWLKLLQNERGRYAIIGEGVTGHKAWPEGYIHGTFYFLRRDMHDAVGLLSERDYPLWGATCEHQLRACRKGYLALPTDIPGFVHVRGNQQFGDSITELLKRAPDKKHWFINVPPEISVIVSCYNYGRYLPDLIGSLIGGQTCLGWSDGQSFASFEVIIVDDASTDNSYMIAKELENAWKGVRVIRHKNNQGTATCWNTGVKHAFGKAVTFICADDMVEPDYLEYMYRALQDDPYSMIYSNMRVFRDGKKAERWPLRDYDFEQLLKKNMVPCGIMITKAAHQAVGGHPEIMNDGREDWAMAIALGQAGYCGKRITYPGYLYRRDGHNRTLRNSNQEAQERFALKIRALFPHLYRGERPMACCGRSNGRSKPVNKSGKPRRMSTPLPGADGIVLVRYVGPSFGKQTFYGYVSGARYSAGQTRPLISVDTRDLRNPHYDAKMQTRGQVPGILQIYEGGKPIFELEPMATPIVAPKQKPVRKSNTTPVLEAVSVVEEIIKQEDQEDEINEPEQYIPDRYLPDPTDMTVSAFWEAVDSLDFPLIETEVKALIALELDGKGRKGIVDGLEILLSE